MKNHLQYLPGRSEPFTMIAVQGGVFNMGRESWTESSVPVHPVELDDFWIGQYPVTQALWTAVMGEESNPSYFKGQNRPVETVSWDLIDQAFLPRLNQLTEKNRLPDTVFRLPTEAEWEYAARGGIYCEDKPFVFSGGDVIDEVGWYSKNTYKTPNPVGLKLENQLGLFDMSGNVWEWCADWYSGYYYRECFDKGIVKNPKGLESGVERVNRGGSWISPAQDCSTTVRYGSAPVLRSAIGFRLVLSRI